MNLKFTIGLINDQIENKNVYIRDHNHSIQHDLDKKRKANFAFLHSGGFSAS